MAFGRKPITTFEAFSESLTVIVSNNTRPAAVRTTRKPWITPEIIRLAKEKIKLYTYQKMFPGNAYVRTRHTQVKTLVRSLTKHGKADHYSREFIESSTNPRKLWRCINDRSGELEYPIAAINLSGSQLTDRTIICDTFNKYFVNVSSSLSRRRPLNTEYINAQRHHLLYRPTAASFPHGRRRINRKTPEPVVFFSDF